MVFHQEWFWLYLNWLWLCVTNSFRLILYVHKQTKRYIFHLSVMNSYLSICCVNDFFLFSFIFDWCVSLFRVERSEELRDESINSKTRKKNDTNVFHSCWCRCPIPIAFHHSLESQILSIVFRITNISLRFYLNIIPFVVGHLIIIIIIKLKGV